MNSNTPVRLGIAGLGGYAGSIRAHVLEDAKSGRPPLQLVAVCEPDLTTHAKVADELRAVGVEVYSTLEQLLSADIEAVWLPVPIDLHRPFTEQALSAGKAVMCEKPAAGAVQDVDAMIAARDRAGRPCAIGFQSMYHPMTIALKRRLLNGDLGQILSASVSACWPRDDRYYGRSTWAGRIRRNGAWVLDSPAQNALSHYLNLALFLLGQTEYDSANPLAVEAELYRARRIENYDTCGLRVRLPGDVPLLTLFTHACTKTINPVVEIIGTRGVARLGEGRVTITIDGKEQELANGDARLHMFQRFANLVRNVPDDRAVATLEVARVHELVVSGASQVAPVYDIPEKSISPVTTPRSGRVLAVPGIEDALMECVRRGQLPHESGLFNWTRPARECDLRTFTQFTGPAKA